ncbi:MBL fold metallo-hydrolase [Halovenus rubra]|uniref:MBL fold metallo-hydrolase n=2 Tax=Halovenus rubra TaxID=869890 RepID=A0ACC7E275_9EURY|nr:MBL fold metallo-hydrolase [Halovenus rubra]
MTPEPVPGRPDIYRLDVPMFEMKGTTSPYVLDTPEPVLIDTGPADAAEPILDALEAVGIAPADLTYIVPTHAHLDHAGGAGHLTPLCENATVVCHPDAAPFLTDKAKLEHLARSVERAIGMPEPYGKPRVIDRKRCSVLGDGDSLDVGDRELQVIDAPGHAPHQFCLYDPVGDVLFSADANGMSLDDGHRPTTPPPDFDLGSAVETIERLQEIGPDTLCYAHFSWGDPGEGTAELREYAEMLDTFVKQVETARDEHGDDVPAVANALREGWGHWTLETDVAGVLRYLRT